MDASNSALMLPKEAKQFYLDNQSPDVQVSSHHNLIDHPPVIFCGQTDYEPINEWNSLVEAQ